MSREYNERPYGLARAVLAPSLHIFLDVAGKNLKTTLVWALDAFDSTPQLLNAAAVAVETYAKAFNAQVIPVYVLTAGQLGVSFEFAEYAAFPHAAVYRPATEKAMKVILKSLKLSNVLPPEVIPVDETSLNQAVDALSQFA